VQHRLAIYLAKLTNSHPLPGWFLIHRPITSGILGVNNNNNLDLDLDLVI